MFGSSVCRRNFVIVFTVVVTVMPFVGERHTTIRCSQSAPWLFEPHSTLLTVGEKPPGKSSAGGCGSHGGGVMTVGALAPFPPFPFMCSFSFSLCATECVRNALTSEQRRVFTERNLNSPPQPSHLQRHPVIVVLVAMLQSTVHCSVRTCANTITHCYAVGVSGRHDGRYPAITIGSLCAVIIVSTSLPK